MQNMSKKSQIRKDGENFNLQVVYIEKLPSETIILREYVALTHQIN